MNHRYTQALASIKHQAIPTQFIIYKSDKNRASKSEKHSQPTNKKVHKKRTENAKNKANRKKENTNNSNNNEKKWNRNWRGRIMWPLILLVKDISICPRSSYELMVENTSFWSHGCISTIFQCNELRWRMANRNETLTLEQKRKINKMNGFHFVK